MDKPTDHNLEYLLMLEMRIDKVMKELGKINRSLLKEICSQPIPKGYAEWKLQRDAK
jgi:hypothetical protein